MARIVRTQKPPEPLNWQKAKPFLRIDFDRRCAYCHIPESIYGSPGNYHVDHFRPRSLPQFTHLLNHYPNLYYACADCNRYKSNAWPQPQLQSLGFYFVDPCDEDPLDHWWLAENGALQTTSRAGEYTVARIHLNRAFLSEWRMHRTRYQNLRSRTLAAIATANDSETRSTLADCLAEIDRKIHEYGQYW